MFQYIPGVDILRQRDHGYPLQLGMVIREKVTLSQLHKQNSQLISEQAEANILIIRLPVNPCIGIITYNDLY